MSSSKFSVVDRIERDRMLTAFFKARKSDKNLPKNPDKKQKPQLLIHKGKEYM